MARRDEVFLVTKCGRYDVAEFDYSAARGDRNSKRMTPDRG